MTTHRMSTAERSDLTVPNVEAFVVPGGTKIKPFFGCALYGPAGKPNQHLFVQSLIRVRVTVCLTKDLVDPLLDTNANACL